MIKLDHEQAFYIDSLKSDSKRIDKRGHWLLRERQVKGLFSDGQVGSDRRLFESSVTWISWLFCSLWPQGRRKVPR